MKITILGCGASSGTPPIGEDFPENPKDIRTRASIFIGGENSNLLIDTSPDLRAQALANKITKIDALIYTHAHADHVHGIDDIKSFNYVLKAPIPCYSNEATIAELKARFEYCFRDPQPQYGWYRPCLEGHVIKPLEKFQAAEFEVTAFRQIHTKTMDSLGIRIGNFAYSTDVRYFPPESESCLKNLDLWIVDCLKTEPAPTHSDLKQTLEWVRKYQPRRTILTHLSYQMRRDELLKKLPENVDIAYDGMQINL